MKTSGHLPLSHIELPTLPNDPNGNAGLLQYPGFMAVFGQIIASAFPWLLDL